MIDMTIEVGEVISKSSDSKSDTVTWGFSLGTAMFLGVAKPTAADFPNEHPQLWAPNDQVGKAVGVPSHFHKFCKQSINLLTL